MAERSCQTFVVVVLIMVSRVLASQDVVLCNGVVFHGIYYDKQLLFNGFGRPYNLMMHKFSGVLFFSHTIQNGTLIDFGIKACHVGTKTCTDIKGVAGGYAIAYDSGNDDIYFGGHDGIYKYNFITKKADFFAEEGKSIWGLFVRRNFYYIEYPGQRLYVYKDDTFIKVTEAANIEVDNFFVSKYIDIYFSNKTALYKVERPNKEPYVLNDDIVVRQIAEDFYGDVYFCASDGVYVEDKPYARVKKVAEIDQTYGITFDENDQLIYSNKNAIYKLVPSKYTKLCLDAFVNDEYKKKEDGNYKIKNLISRSH